MFALSRNAMGSACSASRHRSCYVVTIRPGKRYEIARDNGVGRNYDIVSGWLSGADVNFWWVAEHIDVWLSDVWLSAASDPLTWDDVFALQ